MLFGATFFTTLDLFSGFWQIEIDENDRHKTAFSCEFGHYQYIKMPLARTKHISKRHGNYTVTYTQHFCYGLYR